MCVANEGPTPSRQSDQRLKRQVKGHGLKREASLTSPQFENGHAVI